MPLILPGNVASATASTGYTVANSCRFNDDDEAVLSQTQSTSPTHDDKATVSLWFKIGNIDIDGSGFGFSGGDDASNRFSVTLMGSSDDNAFYFYGKVGGSLNLNLASVRELRDVSAWYHLVVAVDTTQGTEANRVRCYINNEEVTLTGTFPSQNDNCMLVKGGTFDLGCIRGGSWQQYDFTDGYIAEAVLIDGQQLTPSSFGEFDEDSPTIWKPIDVSGLTFGTNGFYLDFEDSADLGADVSGNSNDFTATNLAATDQATDTPTNNFATFNSIYTPDASNLSTFSEGNLRVVSNSTSVVNHGTATIGPSSGKWYAEFKLIAEITGESACGVIYDIGTGPTLYGTPAWSVCSNGDTKYAGSNTGTNNWSGTYTTDDIISVALDLDNNKIYFAKNGSWVDGSGNWDESSLSAYRDLVANKDYFIAVGDKSNDKSSTWDANFGSPPYTISSGNADGDGYGNFEYAVPSGFYALCTKNLAEYG